MLGPHSAREVLVGCLGGSLANEPSSVGKPHEHHLQGGCEAPASPEPRVPLQTPSSWESWPDGEVTQKPKFLGLGVPRAVPSALFLKKDPKLPHVNPI